MTRRLVLSYLTVTALILLILELPLGIFFQRQELDRVIVDVERDASVLATLYEDVLERALPADPAAASDYARRTATRVVVIDRRGISLVDTGAPADRDFETRPEIEAALAGQHATGTRWSDTLGTELVYAAVPIASGGSVHGAVRVTLDAADVNHRITRFWWGLAAVAVVALAVMAGIGWVIARSVTRPIRELRHAAARFAAGDLTPAPRTGEAVPELQALEDTMNAMAADLDDLLERQRRFVADASHQLRSPLTALRLRLENLADASDPSTTGEVTQAVAETERLGRLISDLLMLARAERSPITGPAPVARIVRERVDTWSAVAEAADVQLRLEAPDPTLTATAVEGGTEQLLDNLLENAIRVAPAGSSITVRLAEEDDAVVLEVTDEGPGMDDQQKTLAVDRFWRGDTTTSGTGLGLAIVERLVTAAGGTLELTDNHPRGLRVRILLPRPDRAVAAPAAPTRRSSSEAPSSRPGTEAESLSP